MGRDIGTTASIRELETIYRAHLRRVRWVLRARGVSDDALDDLVHEVFLAIHRRLPDRDPSVPLATWVAGVARNVAFSHRRSEAREHLGRLQLPIPAPAPMPDDELERRRAWIELRAFLDELAAEQREVFIFSELLGMQMPEVAQLVDAPLDTLYSRRRLARRRFADRFADRDATVWLRDAGRQEAPERSRREQGWALVAGQLGSAAVGTVSIGTVGIAKGWIVAFTAAAGVVVVAVTPDREPLSLPRVSRAAPASAEISAGKAPSAARERAITPRPEDTLADPLDTSAVAMPAAPSRDARDTKGTASPARDGSTDAVADPGEGIDPGASSLARAVEKLRNARLHLTAGRPSDALATIDAHRVELEAGPLAREMLNLEREAACRTGRTGRAEAAHAALRAMGQAPGDTPCPAEISEAP